MVVMAIITNAIIIITIITIIFTYLLSTMIVMIKI
jgi:hypothetical protein